MSTTIGLVIPAMLLMAAQCLAICGYLGGQTQASIFGVVLCTLTSAWLVGALLLESRRNNRDTAD